MHTKRAIALFVLTSLAMFAFANGATEVAEDQISGTWFGGSEKEDHAGWKYQYTILPVETGIWAFFGQSAYNGPVTWEGKIATNWTGEIIVVDGEYRARIMIMVQRDDAVPPMELPAIVAWEAVITEISETALTLSYRFGAEYRYDQTPFVDEPVIQFKTESDTPTIEYLRRLGTRN